MRRMRIAISTDGEFVSTHFGRCPSFTIIDIEENKIINKEIINNPGHHPGYLPEFLSQKGVNCIIAGGMGHRAIQLFNAKGIDTILGISGKVNDVTINILEGTLQSGESLCKGGKEKCHEHSERKCEHDEYKE